MENDSDFQDGEILSPLKSLLFVDYSDSAADPKYDAISSAPFSNRKPGDPLQ